MNFWDSLPDLAELSKLQGEEQRKALEVAGKRAADALNHAIDTFIEERGLVKEVKPPRGKKRGNAQS
jgi:hypothetical protein